MQGVPVEYASVTLGYALCIHILCLAMHEAFFVSCLPFRAHESIAHCSKAILVGSLNALVRIFNVGPTLQTHNDANMLDGSSPGSCARPGGYNKL